MGYTTRARVSIAAFECHNTYSAQPTPPKYIRVMASLNKIKLVDPQDDCDDALPIEVLIGADYYWNIVTTQRPIRVSPSLVLLPTIFGFVLSGNRSSTTVNQVSVHYISFTLDEISNESVRLFWDLETIGIKEYQPRALTAKDATLVDEFYDSYRVEDGRKVVSLPRKKGIHFSNNLTTATQRFCSLEKKLDKTAELKAIW